AVPRISRAQSMDALSSQSNVAGYRAALLGAELLKRYFPMLMTAAGTIRPAKVLVLGAGVAGLQAIATAHRLGAAVTGYDVRGAVGEQVQSLGAQVLELEAGKGAEGEGGYARELTDAEKAAQQRELAEAASQMYARNIQSLLELMTDEEGSLKLDFDDEIIAGACVTRDGEIVHDGAKQAAGAAQAN